MKKLIKKVFSISDETIILTAAIATLTPMITTNIIINVLTGLVLINPRTRQELFANKITKYFIFSLPIFLIPSILFENWLGLSMGLWQWYVIFFGIFCACVMTVELFDKMLDVFIIMMIPAGIIAAIQIVLGNPRPDAYFSNSNYYGFLLEFIITFAIYRFYKTGKIRFLLAILYGLLSMFLCNSQGAWVALGTSALFFAVFFIRKLKWIFGTIITGAVSAVLVNFRPYILGSIFKSGLNRESIASSFSTRLELWSTAIEWIEKRPLTGYGPMSMRKIAEILNPNGDELYFYYRSHAHSIYLNILLDYGIIGTLLFITMTITAFCIMKKYVGDIQERRSIMFLLIALAMAFFTHGFVDIPMMGAQTFVLPLLAVSGCGIGYKKKTL